MVGTPDAAPPLLRAESPALAEDQPIAKAKMTPADIHEWAERMSGRATERLHAFAYLMEAAERYNLGERFSGMREALDRVKALEP